MSCRIVSRVTAEPIRLDELLEAGSQSDGALVVFVGRVRNRNEGRPVRNLRYDAYDEMAERELAAILTEAAARWEVGHLEAVHRTGTLELGEASVAVVASAPHRAAAYEASRLVIEQIKQRLPIWKREEYVDGSAAWVGAVSAERSRNA